MVGKRAGDAIEIAIVLGRKSGQSCEKEQQAPQLRQSAAASGDLAAMRSLLVTKSCTPFPVTRLFASAHLSLGACRPAIRIGRDDDHMRWNRQSGDVSASIPSGRPSADGRSGRPWIAP
jgi:hypothetical protein